MSDIVVAFTGSRPAGLGGYEIPNPTYQQVCLETEHLLKELRPIKCISGMCIGYDFYAANVCVKLGIDLLAAIPCVGQESRWSEEAKKQYRWLLSKASEQVVVSPGEYSIAALHRRNEWMIDHCTDVISCWDGSSSGTAKTMAYAEKMGKPIHRIVPIVKETNE
jgi:uncharacterized phage-like protein YoqJ